VRQGRAQCVRQCDNWYDFGSLSKRVSTRRLTHVYIVYVHIYFMYDYM
jgi:hypothetical protein